VIYLRSILFYIGEGLSTIPFFFISMVALPMPPKQRSWLIAGWAKFVTWWLAVTCGLRHEVIGQENIPNDPCVFASNHQSTWETISTQVFLPGLAWVLKKELLSIPFFGWGLWATRPIAIDRQDHRTARDQVIRQGVQKLKQNRHVLIFPQGTRTAYGTIGKFKVGAEMLAREAQVDIVPIAHDAGKYWSKDSWWIKPGTIKCIIGPRISVGQEEHGAITQEIKSWIAKQSL